MTRAELEKEYTIENGIITTPGKFEAEPLWVPYFWGEEGCSDELFNGSGTFYYVYYPTAEDTDQFSELKGIHAVVLWESDEGFVNSMTFNDEESYQAFVAEIE